MTPTAVSSTTTAMSPNRERLLHNKQLLALEMCFPQMMKYLEPNDIVPTLRARGFITSTEAAVIHNMVGFSFKNLKRNSEIFYKVYIPTEVQSLQLTRQKRVQKLIEIVTAKRYWWGPLNHALSNGGHSRLAGLVVSFRFEK